MSDPFQQDCWQHLSSTFKIRGSWIQWKTGKAAKHCLVPGLPFPWQTCRVLPITGQLPPAWGTTMSIQHLVQELCMTKVHDPLLASWTLSTWHDLSFKTKHLIPVFTLGFLPLAAWTFSIPSQSLNISSMNVPVNIPIKGSLIVSCPAVGLELPDVTAAVVLCKQM